MSFKGNMECPETQDPWVFRSQKNHLNQFIFKETWKKGEIAEQAFGFNETEAYQTSRSIMGATKQNWFEN